MAALFTELIIDCEDSPRIAAFWAAVLGYDASEPDEDGEVEIRDPDGGLPTILFITVPERKTLKNRFHIDVNPRGCDQDEELERLLALGATKIDIGQHRGEDGPVDWVVLADPEGNEFCLLKGRRD